MSEKCKLILATVMVLGFMVLATISTTIHNNAADDGRCRARTTAGLSC